MEKYTGKAIKDVRVLLTTEMFNELKSIASHKNLTNSEIVKNLIASYIRMNKQLSQQ